MIRFKIAQPLFTENSFIANKHVKISQVIGNFGYIKKVTNGDNLIINWYKDFKFTDESIMSMDECRAICKAVVPYYNGKKIRGNVWKHSYKLLLLRLHPERGFVDIIPEVIVYKIHPKIKSQVEITSAAMAVKLRITRYDSLKAIVISNNKRQYKLKLSNGVIVTATRNQFQMIPFDTFNLIALRCPSYNY